MIVTTQIQLTPEEIVWIRVSLGNQVDRISREPTHPMRDTLNKITRLWESFQDIS
jgi:hypothetical protein